MIIISSGLFFFLNKIVISTLINLSVALRKRLEKKDSSGRLVCCRFNESFLVFSQLLACWPKDWRQVFSTLALASFLRRVSPSFIFSQWCQRVNKRNWTVMHKWAWHKPSYKCSQALFTTPHTWTPSDTIGTLSAFNNIFLRITICCHASVCDWRILSIPALQDF